MADTKKIYCNQAQQAVYVRNPEFCRDCKTPSKVKTYNELVEKQLPNGTVYELVQVPYPITKDSVKSYADAADYKKDIASAMALPPRGKNLGDLSELQRVLSSDIETARSLYASLGEKIKQAEAAKTQTQIENTEKGVENNA